MAPSSKDAATQHHAWLSQVTEGILEPELPIVDPHHHLWVREGVPYLLPELLEDLYSGHDVTATVFAECHSMYRPYGDAALRPLGGGVERVQAHRGGGIGGGEGGPLRRHRGACVPHPASSRRVRSPVRTDPPTRDWTCHWRQVRLRNL